MLLTRDVELSLALSGAEARSTARSPSALFAKETVNNRLDRLCYRRKNELPPQCGLLKAVLGFALAATLVAT